MEEEQNKTQNEQQERKDFIDKSSNILRERRDILESYDQIDTHELDLPRTTHKMVFSVYQKKTDKTDFLFVQRVGNKKLFYDAKLAFVVAELIRFLTADIVPDDLKPTADIIKGANKK